MTHPSRFRAPSIPIESTAFICAGLATRDCYLATSVDQLGDAVVHQVRSRGRKAPAKRQVEPSAARKTHAASTGLALELISGFGTKLMQEHKTGRTSMVDPEMAMRLPRVKSPSQISKFCVIEPTRFLQCVGVLIGQ